MDSAVAGVKYVTTPGAFTGFTSATGQYQFAEGDTVVFSIGDLKFPEVPAKGVVTPVDIAESADPVNAERIKTNIAALLQSLDVDGNPDNGISIDYDTAVTSAVAVEFNQPYADFAALPAVTTLVANSGSTTTTLVSEDAAVAHLEGSLEKLLVGTWYIHGQGDGSAYDYTLFIIDDHNYAAIDYDSSLGGSGMALEIGTYTWDQTTGKVVVSVTSKTPSELDAAPPMANDNTLVLDGNTLTLTDGDETFELERLVSTPESPLKGGWSLTDEKVFFAFTDTHYFMGQQALADHAGSPGVELGTYSYNADTKAIVIDTELDTNGQWGISHSCAVLGDEDHPAYEESNYLACGPEGRDIVQTLTVTGDILTFVSEADTIADDLENDGVIDGDGEEQPAYFERVNGLPDGDTHLKLELTVEFVEYIPGEAFSLNNGNATMECEMTGYPVVGTKEIWIESWVLGSNPNRPTWASTFAATFNPETKVISFDIRGPVEKVENNETFSTQTWESFSVTYNEGEDEVITGTFSEGHDLTWDLDSSVSSCKLVYTVKGVLR